MDERQEFHALVAVWLKAQGFTYEHEVWLPRYGRVDFLAQSAEGESYLVECKSNAFSFAMVIKQIKKYHAQMPHCQVALAITPDLATNQLKQKCQVAGVRLLVIDIHDFALQQAVKPNMLLLEAQNRIKKIALDLLQEVGMLDLSLRAIARRMEITAPALYHYFPDKYALMTALRTDAIDNQTRIMQQAQTEHNQHGYGELLYAVFDAFRRWSLQNPHQFWLVWDNRYKPADEIYSEPMRQSLQVIMPTLVAIHQQNVLTMPLKIQHQRSRLALYAEHVLKVIPDEFMLLSIDCGMKYVGSAYSLVAIELRQPFGIMLDLQAHYHQQIGLLYSQIAEA